MTQRALKVGDMIRDNDPRMTGRVLRIVALGLVTEAGLQSVLAIGHRGHGPRVRISTRRIHTDGKPRRSGFSLLNSEEPR